ncbi:MAG: hypothetical protein HYY78_02035 [Betaproteobacteria bacterium]|nr:hypothetical protein [Betaproteobacteria bacterium]
MQPDLLTVLATMYGYTYAIVIGHIFIRNINASMQEKFPTKREAHIASLSSALGCIEIFLFTSAFHIKTPEFIPVWLTLKTAAGWTHWNTPYKPNDPDPKIPGITGRPAFNIFLAGNGLVIAFSFIGAQLITWLNAMSFLPSIVTSIAAIAAASLLYLFLSPPSFFLSIAEHDRKLCNKIFNLRRK